MEYKSKTFFQINKFIDFLKYKISELVFFYFFFLNIKKVIFKMNKVCCFTDFKLVNLIYKIFLLYGFNAILLIIFTKSSSISLFFFSSINFKIVGMNLLKNDRNNFAVC